jgi:toxin HigB-1
MGPGAAAAPVNAECPKAMARGWPYSEASNPGLAGNILLLHASRWRARMRLCADEFTGQAELKLDRLDAATAIRDLDLPGNRLEALKGDRKGQYSIRINDQWRICFEWPDKSPGPINVEIVDYH